ncbi:hypothetical protein D3C71_1537930 [compost metagenome]
MPASCKATRPACVNTSNIASSRPCASRHCAALSLTGSGSGSGSSSATPVNSDSSSCTSGIIAFTVMWLPWASLISARAPASISICTASVLGANSAARYSAVRPSRWNSSGLPASINALSTARFCAISVSFAPIAACCNAVKPYASTAAGSAPAARQACTAFTSPLRAASKILLGFKGGS